MAKRDKLQEQLNEAKILQENIQKRSTVVSTFLKKYLNASEFQDFETFLRRTSNLIMENRELGDKISLGEDQLRALSKSLV